MTRVLTALLVLSSATALAETKAPPAAEPVWEELFEDDGITVWSREVPGTSFVEFRGRGPIAAPMLTVAAVIRDADRQSEWMHSCVAARVVEFVSAVDTVVHNRTGSPVPFVADRDTVLDVRVEVVPAERVIWVRFSGLEHPGQPVIDGVVRMPRLVGHWRLRQLDGDTTEVEYQVQADPGGSLPAWLVNWASKKLPYETLMGMRRQVKLEGYDKHQAILGMAIDWSAFLPAKLSTPRIEAAD